MHIVVMLAVALMSNGSFHGDEVPAGTAGSWYALLIGEDGGAALQRVQVTVTRQRDPLLDNGDERTGKRVDTRPDLQEESAVLIRGIAGLRAGRLPTALVDRDIDVDAPAEARLGQRAYRFAVRCTERLVDGQRQERCSLTLRSGSTEQSLFVYSAYQQNGGRYWASERPPYLIWAGDLDGDERLDVLLDASDHYNVREMKLYLSSTAGAGQLVRETARLMRTGC